jgi:hypothetical protein
VKFTDIKGYILDIEENFDVNKWKFNSIHIWPSLRLRLFFYLRKTTFSPDTRQEKDAVSFKKRLRAFIKLKAEGCFGLLQYHKWMQSLPQKKYIFVGTDAHRVDYREARFNRFFDVIIDQQNLQDESLYLEYGNDPHKRMYRPGIIYRYNKFLRGFLLFHTFLREKREKLSIDLQGYEDLLNFLSSSEISRNFAQQNSVDKLAQWAHQFLLKVLFFRNVLKKINPEKIHILCYYNDDIMAMITAANQLNIRTIEMQHGPQTENHLAYGSWSKLPLKGYDMLPREYWCWDQYSKSTLEQSVGRNKLYKIEIIGHPWVNYWKGTEDVYPYKDFILYTLQPGLSIDQLFTEALIKFIKNEPYKWFIRIHPRQMQEYDHIKRFLIEKEIWNLINIEEATKDPLPQLQSNAKLHITHSSGATIEAAEFGVKTILINEIGKNYYAGLIAENKALYIDYDDKDFYDLLKEQIQAVFTSDRNDG